MKKTKQEKKPTSDASKGVKLPLIQSNAQKGNLKENQENTTKGKLFTKGNAQKNNLTEIPQIPNISSNIPLTKVMPKNKKSFENTNSSQNSYKIKGKSETKRKKSYNTTKDDINTEKSLQENSPRFTEKRLSELKKQRNQRLRQEKKEEIKEMQMYEKLIEEYKSNTRKKSTKNKNEAIENNPKVIISSKKAQNILEEGGMLDAYKYVLSQLCKNGLPSGNVFEYASYAVKNYEKKWKEKKSQKMKDKIDRYYEEKQKEINKNLENDGEIKIVNKSLEHRDELKFIQSLDKSRSGRNVVPRLNNNTSPKNDRFSYIGNRDIGFYNKKYNYQTESKVVNKKDEENNENNNSTKRKEKNSENNNKNNNSNSNDDNSLDTQSNNYQKNKNVNNKKIK
jgi:hypothetical protein